VSKKEKKEPKEPKWRRNIREDIDKTVEEVSEHARKQRDEEKEDE
jgi:hypothetical protein